MWFFLFVLSFSCEQATIAAARRRLWRRRESNAAGAHVLFNLKSCPQRLSQGLFLLRAVCAKTFLFLSFASVSNNQTNSPEVSVGSTHRLCCFVVHSMAFFFTPVRGNLCCNV